MQEITPRKLYIVNSYIEATTNPVSCLFINVTQECPKRIKFPPALFDKEYMVKVFVDGWDYIRIV